MPDWSDHSRFRRQATITVDGVETMGTWRQPSWMTTRPPQDSILTFYVTNQYEGRPDHIATTLYGDSTMEWVLIAFNRVRNPLNWPRAGMTIEYPIDSIVFQEL